MIWFWVVVLVLIIGGSAVVIAGRGDAMADVYEDRPDMTVDRGPLVADDVAKVRFTTAVRGYRMDEVDAFVERVEAELRTRSTKSSPHEAESEAATKATRTSGGRRIRPDVSSDSSASAASVPGPSELPPEPTDTPGDESVSSDYAGGPSR